MLETRHFLNWDETAQFLGLDSEGLRQEMQEGGLQDASGSAWLPAMVQTDRFFLASFGFDGYDRAVLSNPFTEELAGFNSDLVLSDYCSPQQLWEASFGSSRLEPGFSLPNRGSTSSTRWHAHHDYGSGWPSCYLVQGRIVLHPEVVIAACEDGGSLEDLMPAAAPPEWCSESNFPSEYFRLLYDHELLRDAYETEGRPLLGALDSLQASAFFRRSDVERIKALTIATKGRKPRDELRSDARATYERIIAALWAKAHGDGGAGKLPSEPYSAAKSLANFLADHGIEKPDADTIGRRLVDAAGQGVPIGKTK